MNIFFKTFATVSMVLGLGAVAHAGVLYAGPTFRASDEFVVCVGLNTGKSIATVKYEVLDWNGSVVATETRGISPGNTVFVSSASPFATACRFTPSGSTKSFRGTLLIRESGDVNRTRAALEAR